MTISIDELERLAAEGWQATEQAPLGNWTLRAAEGFTRRANSALALGNPGMPLQLAIERVRQWYQARALPAMVALAFPLGQPEHNAVDRLLAERGWSVRSGATVMTAGPGIVGLVSDAAISVNVVPEPDNAFHDLYRYRGGVPPPVSRRLLMSAPWQAFASVRTAAGQTVAVGRVAAARGWAGLTAIGVHPDYRRRGFGRLVSTALAGAAAEHVADGLYLQVEDDNDAAHALYLGIGFTDHHGYHYRVEPAS
jgi:ribosomal protein S18 acetylase RimI-like enzyme